MSPGLLTACPPSPPPGCYKDVLGDVPESVLACPQRYSPTQSMAKTTLNITINVFVCLLVKLWCNVCVVSFLPYLLGRVIWLTDGIRILGKPNRSTGWLQSKSGMQEKCWATSLAPCSSRLQNTMMLCESCKTTYIQPRYPRRVGSPPQRSNQAMSSWPSPNSSYFLSLSFTASQPLYV